MRFRLLFFGLLTFISIQQAYAEADNGTYDARVHTNGGTYRLNVDVNNGEVVNIRWPNGDDMKLNKGDLSNGEADARDDEGNQVDVEIDDSSYHE